MKAIAIEQFGGPETLKAMDLPDPVAPENGLVIEVHATSVNPVDWRIREGLLKERIPHEFPLIPGWDAAGVVASVGAGVTRFVPGDRVYAYCRKPVIQWGTYCEAVAVDESAVALAPRTLSLAEAASMPLAALTAWQSLHDFARLQPGEHVAVLGGAGGVGGFAIQLARAAGATVYTTAQEPNHEYVRALGASIAVDYRHEDAVAALKQHRPDGFDVVMDCVGLADERLALTRVGGRLVSITTQPDPERALHHSVKAGYVFVAPSGAQLAEVAHLVDAGAVRAPVIDEQPLTAAAAAEAQRRSREGHVRGKIVLRVR